MEKASLCQNAMTKIVFFSKLTTFSGDWDNQTPLFSNILCTTKDGDGYHVLHPFYVRPQIFVIATPPLPLDRNSPNILSVLAWLRCALRLEIEFAYPYYKLCFLFYIYKFCLSSSQRSSSNTSRQKFTNRILHEYLIVCKDWNKHFLCYGPLLSLLMLIM